MGGRTVAGKQHEQHCDFPFEFCTCIDNSQILIASIKRSIAELELLVDRLEKVIKIHHDNAT